MFHPKISKEQLVALVVGMADADFARFLYCQHMAASHLAVAQFEHMLVAAMSMCDRVRLEKALGGDMDRWEQAVRKQELLQGSTLGSLIKILERHEVAQTDVAYLKWVKDKRDYFVHRLFHEGAWPGDLDVDGCTIMTRRLIAIQHWLARAERRIWVIFERAGFVELDHLADGGLLAMNMGIYDLPDTDL